MKYKIILTAMMAGSLLMAKGQEKAKPEDTEIWEPVPKVVTPGEHLGEAPSDAIILFDGKNLDEWVQNSDGSPAKWDVQDGVLTVNKNYGNIETKRKFTKYLTTMQPMEEGDDEPETEVETVLDGVVMSCRDVIEELSTFTSLSSPCPARGTCRRWAARRARCSSRSWSRGSPRSRAGCPRRGAEAQRDRDG